jgi:hypothetical protein
MILRVVTFTYRAAGQATRPTTGRNRAGIASAAAWATRTGSDFTLLAKIRETTTGFFTNPRRKPPTPALADLAAIPEVGLGVLDPVFTGLLASLSTA